MFDTKETNNSFYMTVGLYKNDFTVKKNMSLTFFKEINCKKSLISNTVYGRRHSKLFTNCHVSWDTLYLKYYQKYQKVLIFYQNDGNNFQMLSVIRCYDHDDRILFS